MQVFGCLVPVAAEICLSKQNRLVLQMQSITVITFSGSIFEMI